MLEKKLVQLKENGQQSASALQDAASSAEQTETSRSQEETKIQPALQHRHATSNQTSQDTQALTQRKPKAGKEYTFLKEMLKFVRLPLINMKQLVTDIKFSGFFEDQAIFEAL